MALPGIDVSHHQGTVDWSAVAAAGNSFAFAKASEGLTVTDAMFSANWSSIAAAGLPRGAYHFYHPSDDPAAQAAHFLAVLAAANGGSAMLNPGDLPPVLDAEPTSDALPSPARYCADLQIFLDAVEAATGCPPIVYTGTSFFNTATGNSNAFAGYPLWIAEYGVAAPRALPAGWDEYTLWQNSESAPMDGVTGGVDSDLFNGDLASLQALTGM